MFISQILDSKKKTYKFYIILLANFNLHIYNFKQEKFKVFKTFHKYIIFLKK